MPKSRGRKPKKKRTPASAPKKRLDNFNTTPQEPALSTQPPHEPPLATAPRRGTSSTKLAVAHHLRRSARSGCPVAALGWPRVSQHVRIARGQLLLGALGTARGSARDTPQAPTSAALARGVGFVRHVLPQSFQNPSKRSDLHENYPADVELTPPTGGPAWRGPSC